MIDDKVVTAECENCEYLYDHGAGYCDCRNEYCGFPYSDIKCKYYIPSGSGHWEAVDPVELNYIEKRLAAIT